MQTWASARLIAEQKGLLEQEAQAEQKTTERRRRARQRCRCRQDQALSSGFHRVLIDEDKRAAGTEKKLSVRPLRHAHP